MDINTLQQLIEHCATEVCGISPRWFGDGTGVKWLVIEHHICATQQSGQYWFDADGNVIQVL